MTWVLMPYLCIISNMRLFSTCKMLKTGLQGWHCILKSVHKYAKSMQGQKSQKLCLSFLLMYKFQMPHLLAMTLLCMTILLTCRDNYLTLSSRFGLFTPSVNKGASSKTGINAHDCRHVHEVLTLAWMWVEHRQIRFQTNLRINVNGISLRLVWTGPYSSFGIIQDVIIKIITKV